MIVARPTGWLTLERTGRLAPFRWNLEYEPCCWRLEQILYSDPLAYFLTWTCYGTWLPGDDRGWTKWHQGDKLPQPFLADWCRAQMKERPVLLDCVQREVVEITITRHCQIRGWHLLAVNCRSNHCHVVVATNSHSGEAVRDQFKSWCTRKLKEQQVARLGSQEKVREYWWTSKGSIRLIFDEESLQAAIAYTLEAQDAGGSKGHNI